MRTFTSLILLSMFSAAAGAETNVVLRAGADPVLEYRSVPAAFKPYVAQLYTPDGVPVLRDSPHDHVHHHALMFACGVDGVNFWEEGPKSGRQVVVRTAAEPPEAPATIRQALDWTGPDGRVLLKEERKIRREQEDGYALVTWESRLSPPEETPLLRLTGGHYYGLGVRFVASADQTSTLRAAGAAEGEPVRGTEKLTPARWIACLGTAGDKPFTLALFDAPDNRRHPALMFSMTAPFTYLSATRNLHRDPLPIAKGEVLTLVHGIALWDGHAPDEEIEEAYQAWVEINGR